MGDTTDAPGEGIGNDGEQSEKVEEILKLQKEMNEMLALEPEGESQETKRTVATNTTK